MTCDHDRNAKLLKFQGEDRDWNLMNFGTLDLVSLYHAITVIVDTLCVARLERLAAGSNSHFPCRAILVAFARGKPSEQ